MIGNYTVTEWLNMGNTLTSEQFEKAVQEYEDKIVALKAELESDYKRFELVQEQEQFAKNALEDITEAMKQTSNCKKLKRLIESAIEESGAEF